jgi:hypothetical protein
MIKLKHASVPDSKFNKSQLKMGVSTEMEHTTSRKVAKGIAKAHLVEIPDYYTRLRKMEKQATKGK